MTDVLKEFLVRIGWDVDEAGLRKFQTNIETVTTRLATFAAGAVAAVAALTKAVEHSADGFEKLFYQMQRTGSSAGYLKALGAAAEQFGSSADEATSAAENLAKKMRDAPGWAHQLQRMGVDTAHGSGKTLQSFLDVVAAMPTMRRNAWLENYGISEKLFYALENPGAKKAMADRAEWMKKAGLDPDKAAADGAKFMQVWRDLWDKVGYIWDGALSSLFDKYGPILQKFGDYLLAHSGEIRDFLVRLADAFVKIATEIGKLLPQIDKFVEWIGGWDKVIALFVAGSLFKLVGSLARVTTLLLGLTAIKPPAWLLSLLGVPAALAGAAYFGSTSSLNAGEDEAARQRDIAGGGNGLAGADHRNWWQRNMPSWLGGQDAPAGGNPGGGKVNVKAAYDLIKKAGGTDDEARTLAAISAAESGGNPGAHNIRGRDNSYGLWQINMLGGMGPERRAKFGLSSNEDLFDPATNARVALQMHRNAGGFRDWTTFTSGAYRKFLGREKIGAAAPTQEKTAERLPPGVPKAGTGYRAVPGMKNFGIGSANAAEAPKNPFGDPARLHEMFKTAPLGVSPVHNSWKTTTNNYSPSQTVTVHVDGSASPVDTANAIGGNLRRAGSDLVRNMRPVAQ
ncbi:Lytic transglycosylase catalytic [Methylocella silvestris BL2]|uniref:Lytic transglycosylase catalytic n=1 Tax=Methylocella silvestris (strain DSM 15510 / CIP 108128 / LMG 27833 / NCIMB 13906 / BL2) TaxID=395965 RepID=B8EKW5_METSB|nr:transglycosylase SLT domain-containing protein [Methylocella silvestris]ACK51993.1 Lytic transglycosylase catalytic [Methylocella silvestris BL2]